MAARAKLSILINAHSIDVSRDKRQVKLSSFSLDITMAEGTNDFLKEIDELLGEESKEVEVENGQISGSSGNQ